ncbi:uncharacterized protein LOC130717015 [Lotus japonicus]|uniref:uncharacterized protein LOC130717015 n=1 Tax=Lotus japonicus TaxID=34305 RepID=UPI0025894108|nr:uncharacterized protein LOC130717015 [Lotus japonicus]
MFSDFEDEDGDSEDLDTGSESGDELEPKPKYRRFKPSESGIVQFECGLTFTNKDLFKDGVKDYALENKKDAKIIKNDKKRVVVACKPECPFYLRISKTPTRPVWQVVSYDPDHTCCRTSTNRQAKAEFLARKLMPILRHTPDIKIPGLIEEARVRWGIVIGRFKAYRAKVRALEMIQGATLQQYSHLRNYAQELLRSNPGSTIVIKSTVGSHGPVFERIYVCFAATKTAFARSCRPLIGLDGCFLKGVYGGQLLSAVGKDGNNQMFPICFAVVEAETKDSWHWFLDLLLKDLNDVQRNNWSFISDQQKGLVPTLASMGDNVEHRLCVKHLYANFKKKYPGDLLKNAMWAAARASIVPEWKCAMEVMKGLNETAYQEMMSLSPKMWTRSAYSTHTKCDLQVNNMCEAFNRAILEHRDKPIITLLEGLKFYLTNRIVKQKQLMLRWRNNQICPLVQQKLESMKRQSDYWLATWCGDTGYNQFEVSRGSDKYTVDLQLRTCACRRWDLSGIPCPHAVSCIWHNRHVPENYVDAAYRRHTFIDTYSHIIQPNNGPKLWPEVDALPLNPPYVRRAPGRPKKMRNISNDEPRNPNRLRRHHTTVKCRRCGEYGHNKRTCRGKTAADRTIPTGGNQDHTQVLQPEQRTTAAVPIQSDFAATFGAGSSSQGPFVAGSSRDYSYKLSLA